MRGGCGVGIRSVLLLAATLAVPSVRGLRLYTLFPKGTRAFQTLRPVRALHWAKGTSSLCMVNVEELAARTLGHYSRRAVQFWEVWNLSLQLLHLHCSCDS